MAIRLDSREIIYWYHANALIVDTVLTPALNFPKSKFPYIASLTLSRS